MADLRLASSKIAWAKNIKISFFGLVFDTEKYDYKIFSEIRYFRIFLELNLKGAKIGSKFKMH